MRERHDKAVTKISHLKYIPSHEEVLEDEEAEMVTYKQVYQARAVTNLVDNIIPDWV